MLSGRMNLWAPYNELRREVDRLLESVTGGNGNAMPIRGYPPIAVWEQNDQFYLEAELPGVAQEDLEISAAGVELTIRGQKPRRQESNAAYHRQERTFGEFTRVLTLPAEIDADKVEATLKDGVLTLTLPKAEAARARKIKVKTE